VSNLLNALAVTPSKMACTQSGNMLGSQLLACPMLIMLGLFAYPLAGFFRVMATCETATAFSVHTVEWPFKWLMKAQLKRMFLVAARRDIFKIPNCIMSFYAILMIGLHTIWTWAKKSLKNKNMNFLLFDDIVARQPHLGITPDYARTKNPSGKGVSIRGITTNSAKIRNAVPAFIANYRAPFLNHFTSSIFIKDTT